MNLYSVGKLLLLFKVLDATQNIITKQLLIRFSEIGLNFCDQRYWLIWLKSALQGSETYQFFWVIFSELLRSYQVVLVLVWTSFFSTDSELTRLGCVIDNICCDFGALTCKQRLNGDLCKLIAFIVTDKSSILTKVCNKIGTWHWKQFWLNVDDTFDVSNLLRSDSYFYLFFILWLKH